MKASSRVYSLILIMILIACLLFGVVMYRPSIQTATYDELISIKGIGNVLADRALSYLTLNPECCLEDLDDVEGIGVERLKLLSKEWK
jgi:hypothetical protein